MKTRNEIEINQRARSLFALLLLRFLTAWLLHWHGEIVRDEKLTLPASRCTVWHNIRWWWVRECGHSGRGLGINPVPRGSDIREKGWNERMRRRRSLVIRLTSHRPFYLPSLPKSRGISLNEPGAVYPALERRSWIYRFKPGEASHNVDIGRTHAEIEKLGSCERG